MEFLNNNHSHNNNNNNHPISSTSAEASDQNLVSSVGGFDKFCAFIVQQYRNLNDNRRLFQGSADSVQQTLHNSTFRMVIDVGTSMFNANSVAGASPQPTLPNGLSGAFSGFPSNTSSSTSSAANQATPMSPLQIAVAAAALNNNIQLFNSLQSQTINPTGNGNGSAQQVGNVQPAFPEFVPRDNGFAQARWNVSDLAETTMLESDISPPQGADVGANGDQIAATATGEKKKKKSASRRKQTSPGKVISSSSSNDNDGSGSSSGNGSPQPSTSGAASTSSSSPSKEEKKASKRSLNAANKSFPCEVSGCKKSYVHEFNLAKHMLVVHPGYTMAAADAASVVVSNDGDGGDAQKQQQQQQPLLNTESIFNSSQPSPDKASPQHGKRPRLDEHADEEEEEEVNEAGGEEAAAEADNAAEQLFSSSDHYQQQQLGDYASMPNDLLMAFWQGSFLNTPP